MALALPFRKGTLETEILDCNRGSIPAYSDYSDVEGDLRGNCLQPENISCTIKNPWPKMYSLIKYVGLFWIMGAENKSKILESIAIWNWRGIDYWIELGIKGTSSFTIIQISCFAYWMTRFKSQPLFLPTVLLF